MLFRIWLVWLDSFDSHYDANGLASQFWQIESALRQVGLGKQKCESCLPKGQAGFEGFLLLLFFTIPWDLYKVPVILRRVANQALHKLHKKELIFPKSNFIWN